MSRQLAMTLIVLLLACASACARTIHMSPFGQPVFPPGPYYSAASKYRLDVIDRRNPDDEGPAPKAMAEIRIKSAWGYRLVSRFELLGHYPPDWAAVTADGSLVVTIDGGEKDVIVLYQADGRVIRRFQPRELLTDGDIELFVHLCSHCRSGFEWDAPAYIDEPRAQLVLRFGDGRNGPAGRASGSHELRIDLRTHEPLEPKRDLWPHPYWETTAQIVENEPAVADKATPWKSTGGDCRTPTDGSAAIPAAVFEQHARHRQPAVYPEIAQRAKITGVVVIELLVSAAGVVECTRVLSEAPVLSIVASLAAQQWTFAPFGVAPAQAYVRGRMRFDFNHGWR